LDSFPELPTSGAQTARVLTLWESQYSEMSILVQISNWELADVLERNGLKGSKVERSRRMIQGFRPAFVEPPNLFNEEGYSQEVVLSQAG
jgi:hypothetical protein